MNIYNHIPAPPAAQHQGPAEPGALDLRHIQDFFWRRSKLIAAITVGVCLLTFVVLLLLTPRYTATAQVLLDPRREKIFGQNAIIPELSMDSGNVDSQIAIIKSTELLRRVVDKLHLTYDPEFGPHKPSFLGGLLSSISALWKSPQPPAAPGEASISPEVLASVSLLRAALDVQRVQRTYVISISVTSISPPKAAKLTNAIADAYVVDQLDARYDAAKRASAWLAERMQSMRDQVRQSEEAVANFRRQNNLVGSSGETLITLTDQQLSELNAKLAAARADVAERRVRYEQAQHLVSSGGNLDAIPDVVKSAVVIDLRKQEADVARREADLVARYSSNHPTVINVRAEHRDIQRSIQNEVTRIIANLKNEYEVAKARDESLQRSLDLASGAAGATGSVRVQLRELERTNQANKTLFEDFLSRAKITQEQASFEEREARVISPATKPGAPSFPKIPLIMALAAIAGIALGTASGVALDMLNSGFSSPRQAEEKLGIPVLATVPLLRDPERLIDGKLLDPARYMLAKPLSRFAESMRTVRMGVQMSNVDDQPRVVLVTSSLPAEGKTTIATSLALSAMTGGIRPVLVDADFRHPAVSKFFGLEGTRGLTELLTGEAQLEEVMYAVNDLVVIPTGGKTQNSADLLNSGRMRELIRTLRERFDYVVLDTPPVAPVVDAKVAAQLADKVVFVVRWHVTSREMVANSLQSFADQHRIAGVVLNLVDEHKTPRYGRYSYYGSSYYDRYYHNRYYHN